MAHYIGNEPANGEFKHLDSIASQFNGSSVTFALQFNSVSQSVGDATQLIVSLNGIIQEPLTAYTLGTGGSNITFASAPASGDTCFIVMLGGVGNTTTPSDNSVTAAKIASGAVTSSKISIDGDISFPDNDKAVFGDGSDLQIYHDGSGSFIDEQGTGGLVMRGTNLFLRNSANENYLGAIADGSVTIYHDNSQKLVTTSTGVDVTGTITSDNGSNTTVLNGNSLVFDRNSANYIRTSDASGYLRLQTGSGDTAFFSANGDILFYEDTGNTAKFFWDASQESLAVGAGSLNLSGVGTNSQNSIITLQGTNQFRGILELASQTGVSSSGSPAGEIRVFDAGNEIAKIQGLGQDATNHDDGALAFSTASAGTIAERMRIDSSGNVGVGTSAPAHKLEVAGTTKAEQYLLDAIAKDISDTAVDVFIYDTRKDSDGGAWRKRTQHTSWYNETLNTATRGARKEFPAVAVIVLQVAAVTIYDGDDPSLPLWMRWNNSNLFNNTPKAVEMVNGFLVVASNHTSAGYAQKNLITANFITEEIGRSSHAGATYGGTYYGGLSYRESLDNSSDWAGDNPYTLVSYELNDVAMTVLPNAPIDSATGLPVPTIAVATDGGVSVIKDDGTVVDIKATNAAFYYTHQVSFTEDNKIILLYSYYGVADDTHVYYTEIPSADKTFTAHSSAINANLDSNSYVTFLPKYSNQGSSLGGSKILATNQFYGGNAAGLVQYDPENDLTKSLAADITSTYNTGWMNGDIKLATLSDTDDTDVTGSELVTNGTFDSDVSGWTVTSNGTLTHSSGSAILEQVSGSNASAYQAITTVVGKRYVASCDITGISARILIGTSLASGNVGLSGFTTGTTIALDFVATSTTTFITIQGGGTVSGQQTTIDNVSVRLAEEDRSVNGNGIQVFGTVTKNPVATGADLVAYSGFTSSNLLRQPYTSDMDFGTGDICVNLWAKHVHPGGNLAYYFFDKADTDGTNRCGAYYIPNSGVIDFYTPSGTARANSVSLNNWSMITFIRSGTISYVYINGELRGTQTGVTENLTSNDQTGTFVIGTRFNGAEPWLVGDLSLVRVSATAPSAEQIKKIYEDEKVLFQENAKATLYGASDAVTALAYDDDTELLHVGTSAGRSVFQGLRRIDNTTDAVGAAISASNGMVAED